MLGRAKQPEVVAKGKAVIKVYRDKADQYRWRLVGSNGKIMADSAEGYVTKHNCNQAIGRLKLAVLNADVVEAAEDLKLR